MQLFVKNHWPPILLTILSLVLCFVNYTTNTFLSGWDTLHPEFNFPLNFERVFFGVFRPEQGLGAVAAHSHMADLPRIIILFFLNFFFSLDLLRYLYVFSNLILGCLGMYLFLLEITEKKRAASFLGALFYLLNSGTMQQFIVPFEMFTTQYALLPWLFLFATQYLHHHTKKTVLFFFIATILATPMAYAATLWYIYFVVFVLYIMTLSLPSLLQKNFVTARHILLLIGVTLAANLFWILPNIYFVVTQGDKVGQAVINQLFSPQAFLYNKEFGTVQDILLLKTFYFDWNIYATNHFSFLLSPWIQHFQNPFISLLGFIFGFVGLIGLIYACIKKTAVGLALLPGLAICLFFLFNDNPPTGWLYTFLQNNIPLFKEALRFPDDKVLGIFTFLFACYIAYAQIFLLKLWSLIPRILPKIREALYVSLFAVLLLIYMFPAFQGELISPYMRIQIPQAYFDMFAWFNKQPDNGRIANLPIHSFWGWEYYDWFSSKKPSFQGAGFIWFGIKQPVLHRDFDRWNVKNEQYYREMSYAIYTKNPELLQTVLQKYNIHYLLFDTSIIAPEADKNLLYYPEIKMLLQELEQIQVIKKVASFGNNIVVYHTTPTLTNNYLYVPQSFATVGPAADVLYEDFVYQNYGTYTTPMDKNSEKETNYPFRSFTTNIGTILPNLVALKNGTIQITPPKIKNLTTFTFPSYTTSENALPADILVEKKKNTLVFSIYPYSSLEGIYYAPITAIAELPVEKIPTDTTVIINQLTSFSIKDLAEDTPQRLGNILLKTKKDNTIALYNQAVETNVVPNFTKLPFSLTQCQNAKEATPFGINILESNSFALFGSDVPVCMVIPLANILPEEIIDQEQIASEILMHVDFAYKGTDAPHICLADLTTGICIRDLAKNHESQASDAVGIQTNELPNRAIKILLEDATPFHNALTPFGNIINQTESEKTAVYENFSFTFQEPFSETTIETSLLQHVSEKPITIRPDEVNIVIPHTGTEETPTIPLIPRLANLCGDTTAVQRPENKKVLQEKDKQSYIQYISQEGPNCDHYSYQTTAEETAYVVAITAKHITGLPLTICLSNSVSKRCNIYSFLPAAKEKTTTLFFLPPHVNNNGFDININNFAIKRTPSINELYRIEVIPFPYYWLTNIYTNQTPIAPTNNSMKIFDVTNTTPLAYSLTAQDAKKGIVALSYAYDNGWKAYQIQNTKFKMQNWLYTIFPFIFGKEVKNHVLVNNWENGWVLDKDTEPNETIVILFWPQYLEYLGFLVLVGTVLWTTRKVYRRILLKLKSHSQ